MVRQGTVSSSEAPLGQQEPLDAPRWPQIDDAPGARPTYESDDDEENNDGTQPMAKGHRRLDSLSALLPTSSTEDNIEARGHRRAKRAWRRLFIGSDGQTDGWLDRNAGFLLIVASQLGFACMNVLVAVLSQTTPQDEPQVPTWEIIWMRQLITWLGCVAWMRWAGVQDPVWGPEGVRLLLAARGFFGFLGLYGIYFSLRYLSLSDATVLTFIAPMLAGVLAVPLLGETYSILEAGACATSLLGVILIAKPEALFGPPHARTSPDDPLSKVTAQERLAAVVAALVGVVGASIVYVVIRKIGSRANALHAISYFSIWSVIAGTGLAIISRSPPVIPHSSTFTVLLIAIGVVGFIAQWLLTVGYQRTKVGKGSAAIYTHVIFAITLQKLCFGTTPDFWSLLGGAIIVGGAIVVATRKAQASETVKQAVILETVVAAKEDGKTEEQSQLESEPVAVGTSAIGLEPALEHSIPRIVA